LPIFDNSKSIFVHIPKCGGTSLVSCFSPEINRLIAKPDQFSLKYMYGRNLQHATSSKLKLLAPIRFHRYYSFSFVRNPWDRMISEYNWRKKWDGNVKNTSFIQMLEKIPNYRNNREPHFYQASEFIMDKADNLIIDYLGYFENIEKDFNNICKYLKLDFSLPKKNVTATKSAEELFSEFYTKDSVALVNKYFSRDITNFGYRALK
jgi:hypothetical protein